jgi:hypothetical protein
MNSASRTHAKRLAVLVAATCLLGSVTYAGETVLSNGVAVTGLSGAGGSETFYRIDVPASQDTLSIVMSGGTGDADLYVRKDAPPTVTTYDYRPYKAGNDETVDVNHPAAGSWYIMVRGYTTYSNVTLKATYSASISVKPLTNGVPVTGLSGAANAELYYSIDVPAGSAKLEIVMSGGTGDADLYVKKGSLPTTTSYDYRPFQTGNNESVSADNPTAGTWYIMIRGYSSFSNVSLLASYTGGTSGNELKSGVPVTNLSGAAGNEKLYHFDLPAGQTSVVIKMSGGTGDADLYVKRGAAPTTTSYDYRPFLTGNDETVTVNAPAAGTWYVMIRAYSAYSGVTLVATWDDVNVLQDEVPVHNLAGAIDSQTFYRIDVPAGQSSLNVQLSGGTGNADLYIRHGSKPTTSNNDASSTGPSNTDGAYITSDVMEGPWYIMIKGTKAYDGATLVADYAAEVPITPLTNGVPVINLFDTTGFQKYFAITVPSGQVKLAIQISGGAGDADLYVRRGSVPTTSNFDYRPYLSGNDEDVQIDNPQSGVWYIMIRARSSYSGLTLLASYTGTTPDPVVTLQNGVPVTGISGLVGAEKFYKIVVPAGQPKLEIVMSGPPTGDADLYVKKGTKPTVMNYDYRPYLIGNNESVSIDNPDGATWYIMIRGYSAFTNVSLKATYTEVTPPDDVTPLTNGVPVPNLSSPYGTLRYYKIDVPAGQSLLVIETSGGTGDCDLYVKKGSKPTFYDYDYRPYEIGNDEKVEVTNPAAATWYILLIAYEAYSGMTLEATYSAAPTGNNFASDPNCVALWRFESAKLTADGVGANLLTNHGVTANTTDKKEGVSSGDFESSQKDYFSIADTDLSAKFPFSHTTAPKTVSLAFWMRLESLPAADFTFDPFSKVNEGANKFTFATMVDSSGHVGFLIGNGTAKQYEDAWMTQTCAIGKWYHVVVTYRDSDRTYRINVWDAATATVIVDKTGALITNVVLTNAAVCVGAREDLTAAKRYFDGLLDEMAVFNDVLTSAEIAKIRSETYGK